MYKKIWVKKKIITDDKWLGNKYYNFLRIQPNLHNYFPVFFKYHQAFSIKNKPKLRSDSLGNTFRQIKRKEKKEAINIYKVNKVSNKTLFKENIPKTNNQLVGLLMG